jgi:hypothetical protein
MPTMIQVSCVGVVLPRTAPKAIMPAPAQKVASMTSGSSRRMEGQPLPRPYKHSTAQQQRGR